jgi:GntR family transcriptional regulator
MTNVTQMMAGHSPLPLYVQIRDSLRRQILNGTYQVH